MGRMWHFGIENAADLRTDRPLPAGFDTDGGNDRWTSWGNDPDLPRPADDDSLHVFAARDGRSLEELVAELRAALLPGERLIGEAVETDFHEWSEDQVTHRIAA